MKEKMICRGDLFYYDFGDNSGSVQSGERPVLVIQADDYNQNAPTIIVAAVTSVIKKRYLPSHIILGEEFGLKKPSMVLLEQIRTVNAEEPIWERKWLTIEEAAAYSGIGRTKLRELSNQAGCPFAIWIGNKIHIVRERLDKYIDKQFRI